jgi:hypothetical protein
MADNLLLHNLRKFGMVTVLDGTFYDTVTDEPLIHFDTLKVSNISGEGSQKEIRGGQGADLLMVYDFGRTANVEITDALASMASLEYLWGGELLASGTSFIYKKRLEVLATNADVFPALPADATGEGNVNIVVYDTATNAYVNKSTTNGTLPTVGDVEFPVGAKLVYYYNAETEVDDTNGVSLLKLTADNFPPTVRFVGDTFLIDYETGKKYAAQIEIPRFKLSADFTLTLDSEGEASVFDFSGMALSNDGDVVIMRTLGVVE